MALDGFLDYLKAGKRCFDIVTESIPKKIEDGVLSVDEMAHLITEICAAFEIKAEIIVPQDFKDKYLDIVGHDTKKIN